MKRLGRALMGAMLMALVGVLVMTLMVKEPAGAQGTTTTTTSAQCESPWPISCQIMNCFGSNEPYTQPYPCCKNHVFGGCCQYQNVALFWCKTVSGVKCYRQQRIPDVNGSCDDPTPPDRSKSCPGIPGICQSIR